MSILNAVCTNAKCLVIFLGQYAVDAVPSFCPACGAGVIEKCPNCNTQIPEHGEPPPVFCDSCGQRLRFDPDPSTGEIRIIKIGE